MLKEAPSLTPGPNLGAVGRLGRWHAPAPRGPRYWLARGVALATYLPATMLFGGFGWLDGIGAFIFAEIIAHAPLDLQTTAPETSAGAVARQQAASRLATIGLLFVAAAALYPFRNDHEGQGALLALVVLGAEWSGPRLVSAVPNWRSRRI